MVQCTEPVKHVMCEKRLNLFLMGPIGPLLLHRCLCEGHQSLGVAPPLDSLHTPTTSRDEYNNYLGRVVEEC